MTVEEAEEIRPRLEHVLWVAGGTCSGKTSITTRLAREWDMIRYDGSERFRTVHLQGADGSRYPLIDSMRRSAAKGKPGWASLATTPEELLQLVRRFSREALELAVADLLMMPRDHCIVVDSFRLSFAVSEIIALGERGRVIFLAATSEFQRSTWARRFDERFEQERTSAHLANPDSQAEFVERLCIGTDWLRNECNRLRLPFLETGGCRSFDEVYAHICNHFGLR